MFNSDNVKSRPHRSIVSFSSHSTVGRCTKCKSTTHKYVANLNFSHNFAPRSIEGQRHREQSVRKLSPVTRDTSIWQVAQSSFLTFLTGDSPDQTAPSSARPGRVNRARKSASHRSNRSPKGSSTVKSLLKVATYIQGAVLPSSPTGVWMLNLRINETHDLGKNRVIGEEGEER